MRFQTILTIVLAVAVFSCKREKQNTPAECVIPAIVPFQPYSDPVWHPNGNILAFNYTPLSGIAANGTAPCLWYTYFAKVDSTGFYLMNKNGTSVRRATNFRLIAPSWSRDGNWLAFSVGPNIYKMPFNGSTFDTSRIIRLTSSGGNFYPSWTANGDTVYYDSNNDAPNGSSFYSIWKMASDGSGKTRLTQSAGVGDSRQPFVGSDGKVYYIGLAGEIYQMDRDGGNQQKYSNNGFAVARPRYWQGKVFYETNQIGVVQAKGSAGLQLTTPAITYDVSPNGEIVFSKMVYDITKSNKQNGAFWIMNEDGSNQRQLTFNNF